jgi:hypothetical protein
MNRYVRVLVLVTVVLGTLSYSLGIAAEAPNSQINVEATPGSTAYSVFLPSLFGSGESAPPDETDALPYGPFHNSDFSRTFFDGAFVAGRRWKYLENAREHGYRVFAAAAVFSPPCVYMPDGPENFDVDAMVAAIVARRSEILEYASDGTLMGLLELNEPHDPNCENWGGEAGWKVPQWALYEVAERFWSAFPELSPDNFYFGYDTPPAYIEAGGGSPHINVAFIQYSTGKGELPAWAKPHQDSAARQGMKLVYSANLDQLGVEGTVNTNIWECQQPDAVFVTFWRDDFINDADGPKYEQAKAACDGKAVEYPYVSK